MRLYILNAFSLSMLDRDSQNGTPSGYTPVPEDSISTARIPRPVGFPSIILAGFSSDDDEIVSAVGHANTAAVFSSILSHDVTANRISVKLGPNDRALIGQYVGPRLAEGATELPDGAKIEWWII